ncbi:hypothetical protein ABZ419_19060 [Streptomyces cinnamoneus]|uniref:tetratricopeptide repeat protein n=1 Tax=Streptomyces cinnamoneus TaxID=53446 RepID=UPI0033EC1342
MADRHQRLLPKITAATSVAEVERLVAKLRRGDPDFPVLMTGLIAAADAWFRLGDTDRAERALREVIARCGAQRTAGFSSQGARVMLAWNLGLAGRHEESDELYRSALNDARPNEPRSLLHILCLALSSGSTGPHQASFLAAALRLLDESPKAFGIDELFTVGTAAFQQGDSAAAFRCQEPAYLAARQGNDSELIGRLAQNLVVFAFRERDFHRIAQYAPAAIAALELTASDQGDLYLAYYALACEALGRPEDGLATLDLLDRAPERVSGDIQKRQLLRAGFLVQLKRHQEALQLLRRINVDRLPAQVRPNMEEVSLRLARETRGPLYLDCVHDLVALSSGQTRSDADHARRTPFPARSVDPDVYREPGLSDEDRATMESLQEQIDTFGGLHWASPSTDDTPARMQHGMVIHYVDDVARFEAQWRLHRHERSVRSARAKLARDWPMLMRSLPSATPQGGTQVKGSLGYILTVLSLADTARLYAVWGDREQFHHLAAYCADLLELVASDPMLAALAWAARASLATGTYIIGAGSQSLAIIELNRSLDQFLTLLQELDDERRQTLITGTVNNWLEICTPLDEELRGFGELANEVERLNDRLDKRVWSNAVELLAMAKRHTAVHTLLEHRAQQLKTRHPGVRLILTEELGTRWGTALFRTLVHSEEQCEAVFGPFGPWLHQEVDSVSDCSFAEHRPQAAFCGEPVPEPMAFTDNPLMVMLKDLGPDYPRAMMHENQHLSRRNGQMLQTADGVWRHVSRDVPTAAALTYANALDADDTQSRCVNQTIQDLVAQGAAHARRDPTAAGGQVQNMLRYFDAMGEQESPASYPCAALLVGMARVFTSTADRATNYLHHLTVVDHDDAVAFAECDGHLRL